MAKHGTALLIGGTALSIYGKYRADKAEAAAEEENALWLEEQAVFALESAEREGEIFELESDRLLGEQLGGFARAGVTLSSSAIGVMNETRALANDELNAIEKAGEFRAKEARLKSGAARKRARGLKSKTNLALGIAGSVLTGAAGRVK